MALNSTLRQKVQETEAKTAQSARGSKGGSHSNSERELCEAAACRLNIQQGRKCATAFAAVFGEWSQTSVKG